MKRLIYINSNDDNCQYINEAVISAQSFRKFVHDCEIVLYTNQKDFQHEVFDHIFVVDFVIPPLLTDKCHLNGQMAVKHMAMIESPAEYNLVLGSDTFALSDKINDAFSLLEKFDFALAHAPGRVTGGNIDIPHAWPEFNCDVIFYRKNNKTQSLLKEWKEMYISNQIDHPHDQGSFRYLTYHRDVKVATLPFEYNNRAGLYGSQGALYERENNKTVILQNRALVTEILTGETTIEEIIERSIQTNKVNNPCIDSIRAFIKRGIAKFMY